MPKHKTPPVVAEAILAGKRARKSHRKIAQEVEDQFGIKLDQRTIGRKAKRIAEKLGSTPTDAKKTKRPKAPKGTQAVPTVKPLAPDEKLDEVERLEASIRRIEHLLSLESTPIQAISTLSGELRKTFAALRTVKRAIADGLAEQDTEANELRKLLQTYLPVDAAKPNAPGSEVPDEPGSTGSIRSAAGS